jgi:hypothetical protein
MLSLPTLFAQTIPDPLWLFRDSIPVDSQSYYQIEECRIPPDSLTGGNIRMYLGRGDNGGDCFSPVDTGTTYKGEYLNFNYSTNQGYAGFKLFWDMGTVTWNAAPYNFMCFAHKGLAPGQTAKIFWSYSERVYVNWMFLGEFRPSTVWKNDSIQFPPEIVRSSLHELCILIYDSTVTVSPAGPCNVAVDNISFIYRQGVPSKPTPIDPKGSLISGTREVLLS